MYDCPSNIVIATVFIKIFAARNIISRFLGLSLDYLSSHSKFFWRDILKGFLNRLRKIPPFLLIRKYFLTTGL